MVTIHEKFKEGVGTVDLEYPWITPSSTCYLDSVLTNDLDVLEFGCGGSTLFFARRCKSVTSFETNFDWREKVFATARGRKIKNIAIHLVKDRYETINILKDRKFDVIMVDNDPGRMSRANILRQIRNNTKPKSMVVLDNYSNKYCGKCDIIMSGYDCKTFDYPNWDGSGTKVYLRGWK